VEVRSSQPPVAPGAADALAPGISSIEIQDAILVLGGLKLETAGIDDTVDWELKESVVIPLDLAGNPTLAFDADVPPGTYKELEISIDKLEVGHPTEQVLIELWPTMADASVEAEGVLLRNGVEEPFRFNAALDIDMELDFPTPFTILEGQEAVTVVSLSIDLSEWFLDEHGVVLDPNDSQDRSEIEAAITRSIEVVKES